VREDFSDAALVLLGHGTTLNADSAAPVYQHATELRHRKLFAEVREAFWKQTPNIKEVITQLSARRVFIVPLFISEGYFSEEIIPKELGFRSGGAGEWRRSLPRGNQTFFYCKPVGTHDKMTDVLLARARDIVSKFPFPRAPNPDDTTLLIAGHGTERNENSRKAIERQADLIRNLKNYAAVHAIFLEEEPRISQWHQLVQTRNAIIVPFFISDGLHTREDIPVLLGESQRLVRQRLETGQPAWRNPMEKKGKLVWYSSSVGSEPCLAEVILERVREAAVGQ
jgi:sirohydrochlorin cobaltochelatase